ncbi:unnamed protein product [Linum trigynum]|uniref:RNase H type-1 domain-containing protein n=1 Tax=Linum trigynum TaxID=586398 RepID=A0AAV2FPI0_9ROSI
MGGNLSCGSWLCEVMEKVDDELVEQLGMILWYLWNEQNNHLFNNKKMEDTASPKSLGGFQISTRAGSSREDGGSAYLEEAPAGVDQSRCRRCNFLRKCEGFGAVARDASGSFLGASVRRERVEWPAEMAELRAMDLGLQLAEKLGQQAVIIESDCQQAVFKLLGEEMTMLEAGSVVEELKEKDRNFGEVKWQFARRACNMAAHNLAHIQCNWDSQEDWVGRPPIFLLAELDHDFLSH